MLLWESEGPLPRPLETSPLAKVKAFPSVNKEEIHHSRNIRLFFSVLPPLCCCYTVSFCPIKMCTISPESILPSILLTSAHFWLTKITLALHVFQPTPVNTRLNAHKI